MIAAIRIGASAPVPNWPLSDQAPQAANAARMAVQAAVSRWLQRKAAHNSGNMTRMINAFLFTLRSMSGLKARKPSAQVARNATPEADFFPNQAVSHSKARQPWFAQRTSSGAITSKPAESRSHQMIHREIKSDHATVPMRPAAPTATVAPSIALGPRLTTVNFAARAGVSNVSRPADQRFIKQAPTTASSVAAAATDNPTMESAEVGSAKAVGAWAAKPAAKIAGQIRRPRMSIAANANPGAVAMGIVPEWIAVSAASSLARAK